MYLYKAIKNHKIQRKSERKKDWEDRRGRSFSFFSSTFLYREAAPFFIPRIGSNCSIKNKSLKKSSLSLSSYYGNIFSNLFLNSMKENRLLSRCTVTLPRTDSNIVSFATKEFPQVFWNLSFNKGILKNFVFWCFVNYGQRETIKILEKLQIIGFGYATKAGISLSIDDLKIPPTKAMLLADAEKSIEAGFLSYKKAQLTGLERFQRIIETWHKTSENLKDEMINNFRKTDSLNPVYMMAFSGARGNISQVRQLVAMRGLMSDPQGKILDFPIRSNFREGLTLTEYVISCYGARKGVVDTALRTANAGYLTRRLVDVAQHVIVLNFDCGTKKGFYLTEMKKFNKTLYPLRQRLLGRVLAAHLYNINSFVSKKQIETEDLQIVAFRNQEISEPLAEKISKITNKVFIRSPLTCDTPRLVCQLCYGWSLSEGYLVSIGEAVGIIAAQSIGEPGTQLTMRTFHTGGVFAGEMFDQLIAPYDGIVQYSSSIPGTLVRTTQGKIAFLTKVEGKLSIFEKNTSSLISNSNNGTNSSPTQEPADQYHHAAKTILHKSYKLPAYTLLFLRNNEIIVKDQLIAELAFLSSKGKKTGEIAEFIVKSEMEGQLYSGSVNIVEKYTDYNDIMTKSLDWGSVWILSGKICQLPVNSSFFALPGDLVDENAVLSQIQWIVPMKSLLDTNSLIKQNRNKEIYFDFNLNQNKWFQKRNLETLNTLFNLKFGIKKKNRTNFSLFFSKAKKRNKFLKKSDFFSDLKAPLLKTVSKKNSGDCSYFPLSSKKALSYYPFAYLAKLREKKFKLLADFYPNLTSRNRGQNSKAFKLFFTKLKKNERQSKALTFSQSMIAALENEVSLNDQSNSWLQKKSSRFNQVTSFLFKMKIKTINDFSKVFLFHEVEETLEKKAKAKKEVEKTRLSVQKKKAQLFVGFKALKKNELVSPIPAFTRSSRLFPIFKQKNSILSETSNQLETLFDLKNKISINLPLIFLCIDNIYYKKVGYFFSFKMRKKQIPLSSDRDPFFFSLLKKSLKPVKKKLKPLRGREERMTAYNNEKKSCMHAFELHFPHSHGAKAVDFYLKFFDSSTQKKLNFFSQTTALDFKSLYQDIFFVPTLLEQKTIISTKGKNSFKKKNYISNQLLHWFPKSYLTMTGGICIYLLTHDFFCHYINFQSFSFFSEKKKGPQNIDRGVDNLVSSNLLAKIFWVNQDYKKIKLYTLKFFSFPKLLQQLRAQPIHFKKQNRKKLRAQFFTTLAFHHFLISVETEVKIANARETGAFPLHRYKICQQKSKEDFFPKSKTTEKRERNFPTFATEINLYFSKYKTKYIKKYKNSFLSLNFYKNLTYYCFNTKNKSFLSRKWKDGTYLNDQSPTFSLKKTNIVKKRLTNNSIMNSFIYKPQKLLSAISLHKKFFLPGQKIVDDISFDNFLIYVECIPEYRLSSLFETIYNTQRQSFALTFSQLNKKKMVKGVVGSVTSPVLSLSCFNLKKLIINKTPRFIKTSQFLSNIPYLASDLKKRKLFKSGEKSFVLLLTKVSEYPLYKPNHYKDQLYNKQKTGEQSFFHYSCKVKSKMLNKIFKNNYHSNALNKQKSSLRLLDKFPNTDLVLALKCKGIQKDFMENFLKNSLNLNLYLRLKKQKNGILDHTNCPKRKILSREQKKRAMPSTNSSALSFSILPFTSSREKKLDFFSHFAFNLITNRGPLKKASKARFFSSSFSPQKTVQSKAQRSARTTFSHYSTPFFGALAHGKKSRETLKRTAKNRQDKSGAFFEKRSQSSFVIFRRKTFSKSLYMKFFSKSSIQLVELLLVGIQKNSLNNKIIGLTVFNFFQKNRLKEEKKKRLLFFPHLARKKNSDFLFAKSFKNIALEKRSYASFIQRSHSNFFELENPSKINKTSVPGSKTVSSEPSFFTLSEAESERSKEACFFKKHSTPFLKEVNSFTPREFDSPGSFFGESLNSKASFFNFLDKKLKKNTRIQAKFVVCAFEKSEFSSDLIVNTKKKYFTIGKSYASCFTTFNYENIKIMNNNISQSVLRPSFYFNSYQKYPFGYYLINNLNASSPFSFSFYNFFSKSNNKFKNYFLFYKLLSLFNRTDSGKKSALYFSPSASFAKRSHSAFVVDKSIKPVLSSDIRSLLNGKQLCSEPFFEFQLQVYEQSTSYFSLISCFFQQPCFDAFFTQQVSFGYNEIKNMNFSKKVGTLRKGTVGLSTLKKSPCLESSFLRSKVYFNKDCLYGQGEIALTHYLSPVMGEILRHENYYWSQNTQKNRYLLLTKKDQISFFSNNSNTQKENLNNFFFSKTKKFNLNLGKFLTKGDCFRLKSQNYIISSESGLLIHSNKSKITLRKAQSFFLSPNCIFHYSHGDLVEKNKSILSLPYEQLKTGDIVQGIPKVEQLLEARSTFKGKEEEDNLHQLLRYVFELYKIKFSLKLSVRKSFSFIQLILVNSVQRIYRSQGVSISDKHLEVIVKQMTSKVQITSRGDSSFFRGEHVDLYIVETWNALHPQIKKICYKPILLGISRSSLEVNSFLSAASFQHTKKVLSRSAFKTNIDFLNGLKENVIIGNLISAGTGNLNN